MTIASFDSDGDSDGEVKFTLKVLGLPEFS